MSSNCVSKMLCSANPLIGLVQVGTSKALSKTSNGKVTRSWWSVESSTPGVENSTGHDFESTSAIRSARYLRTLRETRGIPQFRSRPPQRSPRPGEVAPPPSDRWRVSNRANGSRRYTAAFLPVRQTVAKLLTGCSGKDDGRNGVQKGSLTSGSAALARTTRAKQR
jgi:hypothetical protein